MDARSWRGCLALAGSLLLMLPMAARAQDAPDSLSAEMLVHAEKILGIAFTPSERDSMLEILQARLADFARLRELHLDNAVPPALQLRLAHEPHCGGEGKARWRPQRDVALPERSEDLAFYPVADLAALIRTRKITATELTELYLERLKRFGPELECVITLTEDLALRQARHADEEIAAGRYRGPLHGIPYGAKDLLAVAGYPTTWGAEPYKDQVLSESATVVVRLEEAGAILVAKLTLGALAWGDVWFGGTTRNPWDPQQGSSGSSAGSASATAAGLVGFAIGTETWGSIVSPCTRCGVTGLRPTYGRVSRTGAMALSWSMDKIGPIARTAEDCALVFAALHGADGIDPSAVTRPFAYSGPCDLRTLRIGYLQALFEEEYPNRARDEAVLNLLRGLGAELIPITLPDLPIGPLALILEAEAAAAFDQLTLSGRDDLLVRQIKRAWPNVLRAARLIPAVEYIQANRVRQVVMTEMAELMRGLDLYVAPSFGGDNLLLTNLTGHPCVVVPNGFDETGHPVSISFIGRHFGEAEILAVAAAYQEISRMSV